jgi:hypothetical protein
MKPQKTKNLAAEIHFFRGFVGFRLMDNKCNETTGKNGIKIQSISVQTQLDSIYYIELHVSTYLRSSSGSQFI